MREDWGCFIHDRVSFRGVWFGGSLLDLVGAVCFILMICLDFIFFPLHVLTRWECWLWLWQLFMGPLWHSLEFSRSRVRVTLQKLVHVHTLTIVSVPHLYVCVYVCWVISPF